MIQLHRKGIDYKLWRLTDEEDYALRQSSIPIASDASFNLYYLSRQEDALNLAQFYVVLKHLFGESSSFFDDWKSSFYFPIFLQVKRKNGEFPYFMHIFNHRSTVEFNLFRYFESLAENDDRYVYHQPFESELSRPEINDFICYFYGYLQGRFEAIQNSYSQEFLKRVDSNLILFGYKEGQFFEEHYDDSEAYKQAAQAKQI
jgi:hypothetical protein